MWKYVTVAALLLGLPLSLLGYYRCPHDLQARQAVELVVEGETLCDVARRLARNDLLRMPRLFAWLARTMNMDHSVQAGEYILHSSMSPREILRGLSSGEVILYRITVPEGYSVKQVAVLLDQNQLAPSSILLEESRSGSLAKELGVPSDSLEGYLFPDTYYFSRGHTSQTLLGTMVRQFWKSFDESMRQALDRTDWSLHEVVTMASIVEAETSRKEEKPLIASVMINRLKKGMPLQADPTVIYGLDEFDGNLKKEHLLLQHPYNTYSMTGLPPGPICNPGIESLKAVLSPADTPYLFFVSRNDGTHEFSATLGDHNRAVLKFQKSSGKR
ncbi:MAG: endolytic transglycosylase MltG [bacterium]